MNKEVNFEIAKLLKDKGFDEPCYNAYNKHGMQFANGWLEYIWEDEITLPFNKNALWPEDVLAPTIAEVVMWLYEKYGIWISVQLYVHLGNVSKFQFTIQSQKSKSINSIVQLNTNPFNSPTEAYSAAIEYTLNNLL